MKIKLLVFTHHEDYSVCNSPAFWNNYAKIHYEESLYWLPISVQITSVDTLEEAMQLMQEYHNRYIMQFLET